MLYFKGKTKPYTPTVGLPPRTWWDTRAEERAGGGLERKGGDNREEEEMSVHAGLVSLPLSRLAPAILLSQFLF